MNVYPVYSNRTCIAREIRCISCRPDRGHYNCVIFICLCRHLVQVFSQPKAFYIGRDHYNIAWYLYIYACITRFITVCYLSLEKQQRSDVSITDLSCFILFEFLRLEFFYKFFSIDIFDLHFPGGRCNRSSSMEFFYVWCIICKTC